MKTALSIATALMLTACAGPRWLNDQQFQSYVSSLHLTDMSLTEATAKLASAGFVCEPHGEEVSCSRSINAPYGGETQQVLLSAPAGPGSPVKVETSLSIVVS